MEENENVKKNTKKKIIIVVSIILVLLIIIISILLLNIKSDKKTNSDNSNKQTDTMKSKSDEKEEDKEKDNNDNNNQTENKKEYVDESYVCPEGLELLVDFIGYRGTFGPNNMFDNKDIRVQYIQFLLMKENKATWTSGDYQSFPYISEVDFKNKYYEIFNPEKYQYENDQDSIKFIDCNSYEETKNKNYKCWNGTWGVYGNKIYLYVNNKDDKTISGEFKRSSNESGLFEIKYSIKNNKKYLKSVVMMNN